MHRLTDIWSNLISGTNRNENETVQYRERMDRMERITDTFNNLYWTRVISMQDNRQEFDRYPMADDIVETWNEIDEIGRFDALYHKIYFDPRKFLQENPEPTIQVFKRDDDDIRHWGYRCS